MQEAVLTALLAFHLRNLESAHSLAKNPLEIAQVHSPRQMAQKLFRGNPIVTNSEAPNEFSLLENRIKKSVTPKKTTVGQKLLIISPHPDDEILCCSSLIEKRLKAGDSVKIVYVTDGDALNTYAPTESRRYGNRRRSESLKAVLSLGLNREDLFFLNFPDGALRSLKDDSVLMSPYTQQKQSLYASIFNHSQYTRKDLKQNLAKIITRESPDEIYMASPELDDHADHQIPSELIQELLNRGELKMKKTPQIFQYAIHRKIPLARGEFDPRKKELIEFFKSQFHDEGHESFLEQFSQIPEEFSPWEPPHLVKSE